MEEFIFKYVDFPYFPNRVEYLWFYFQIYFGLGSPTPPGDTTGGSNDRC